MQKSGTVYDTTISTTCITKENMVNYGNVNYLLSEKQHKWNIELFLHQGIIQQAKGRDDRITINPWLTVIV